MSQLAYTTLTTNGNQTVAGREDAADITLGNKRHTSAYKNAQAAPGRKLRKKQQPAPHRKERQQTESPLVLLRASLNSTMQ